MGPRPARFPLFDAMRAIAALSVLLYHGAFRAFPAFALHGPLRSVASHLDVGVPIFFLISGFLLYRPFAAARLGGHPSLDARTYGLRRARRIVPGYWVALTLTALVMGATASVFTLEHAPLYFGFAQIYRGDTVAGGIGPAWSLCVEVAFYAFLPLWAAALRRLFPRGGTRSELLPLGGLFAFSVGWQWVGLHHADPNAYALGGAAWLESLPAFLDHFALGMALAVLSVAWAGRPLPRPVRVLERWPSAAWVLAGGAFWAACTQLGDPDRLTRATFLARHQLYALVAAGLLLPAVFGDSRRGMLRRALSARPLLFVGTISYGVYLYHVTIFSQLWRLGLRPSHGVPSWLWLAAGATGSVGVASLSWWLVERPALRTRRGPRRSPRPAAPEPEPAPA